MSERHDWLNLVEVSGPFLSIPVLDEAFPQGMEGRDKRDAARIRQAYDEWREAVDVDDPSLDELHRAWVDEALATALQMGDRDLRRGDQAGDALHVSLPEHGMTLTPDIVLVNVNYTDKPLLPMFVQPPNAPLDEVVHRDGWAASPAERMVHYLRGVDCPIGLVTNGERWMLVHAPTGQVTSFVSWYARLWSQEPETLRAFVSLLAVPRFYGPEEGQLPSLFARSEKHQDEVTEALGDQVRTAIEVLIQAIDKANQDRNGKLLEGVTPQELYEGGLTVMMRLVFILSAEERGLLLLGNTTYDNHYALSTFRQRLRRVSSNAHELLERRHAGWSRLLALFRAIYGGIEHSDLRLPAMGGSLFDPDRYPFLEGRAKGSSWLTDAADPLPIDDRTVLLMLDAIQSFEGRTLSYRALDVEQIGHVYEGLLERTVRQIDEVTLELRGSAQAKSPKATLRELAEAGLDGQETLIELLKERTGRSVPALRRDLQRSRDDRLSATLLTACRGEVDLHDRVEPYVHLLALDPWDHPRLYHPGAYAVVLGSDRRETGTHYTPKSLTEKIVHETLTPVVYVGPAEGKPKEKWQLKSPAELLDLKICDPAMGSGAFLVQACRWLGERLVEAWSQAEAAGGVVSVDGEVLENAEESELLPRDGEERTVIARRLVAERCLYGVDMNPLAVELAKLSIWLVTLAEGRPFGFLDHNLRCGDSLLGIHRLDQLTQLSMQPKDKGQQRLFGQNVQRAVYEAIELRQRLRAMSVRDVNDIVTMARLDTEARHKLEVADSIADAFIGEALLSGGRSIELEYAIGSLAVEADEAVSGDYDALRSIARRSSETLTNAAGERSVRHPLHWPLEYPEVFVREAPGFDAVVGNPPFLGNRLWRAAIGEKMQWQCQMVLGEPPGKIDICVVFHRRAVDLLRQGGCYGLLAASNIAEGSAIKVGLRVIVQRGDLFFAKKNMPWPGAASVVVAVVGFIKGKWQAECNVGGQMCARIGPRLEPEAEDVWVPQPLMDAPFAFAGVDNTKGMAFIITPISPWFERLKNEPDSLLRPYITGDDITSNSLNKINRWALDIGDLNLEDIAKSWPQAYLFLVEVVQPSRTPEALKSYKELKKNWWRFLRPRADLMRRLRLRDRFIGYSKNTKYPVGMLAPSEWIYTNKVLLVGMERDDLYAISLSTGFRTWLERFSGGSLGETLSLSISESVAKYPVPTGEVSQKGVEVANRFNDLAVTFSAKNGCGLTDVMNAINSSDVSDADVEELRHLMVTIDAEVLAAYGWDDLEIEYGFRESSESSGKYPSRWALSEELRVEILHRLIELNREYCEEKVSEVQGYDNASPASKDATGRKQGVRKSSRQAALNFNVPVGGDPQPGNTGEAILDFLRAHEGWHAKSNILVAVGLTDSHWSSTIRDLIDRGLVERHGERRGARYRAVRNDS
ncbi:Eco57I restriction-modification methylase domain-containing protein [Vreelandella venusta]